MISFVNIKNYVSISANNHLIQDNLFLKRYLIRRNFSLEKREYGVVHIRLILMMSGNFEYIYNEMLRQNLDKKYDIHTVFKANITDRRSIIDKFRLPYLLGKADYIFVDDFHPLIYTVRFRRSQEVIQVWHALVPLKQLALVVLVKRCYYFIILLNHRRHTKAYVSSETDIPFSSIWY